MIDIDRLLCPGEPPRPGSAGRGPTIVPPSGIRVAVRQEADKDTGRACGPEA